MLQTILPYRITYRSHPRGSPIQTQRKFQKLLDIATLCTLRKTKEPRPLSRTQALQVARVCAGRMSV